jgi:hypothetical protein
MLGFGLLRSTPTCQEHACGAVGARPTRIRWQWGRGGSSTLRGSDVGFREPTTHRPMPARDRRIQSSPTPCLR